MEIQVFDPKTLQGSAPRFSDEDSAAAGVAGGFATLSVDKGRFTPRLNGVVIPSGNNTELQAVVVAMYPPGRGTSRVYFGGTYDPNNTSEPVCQSDDGLAPRTDVTERQHGDCATCPMNQPGSGERPGTRACRFVKNVGVVIPSYSNETVFQLRVSAQGIFDGVDKATGAAGLLAYATQLGSYRRIPQEVMTELSIPDGLTGGVRFKAVGLLNDSDAHAMVELGKKPETMRVVGPRGAPRAATPALPQLPAMKKEVPPQVTQPEPSDNIDPPSPQVVETKPEPKLTPKPQAAASNSATTTDDALKARIQSAFGAPK